MNKNISKYLLILLGPLAACLIWLFADLDPANPKVTLMAACGGLQKQFI